MKAVLKKLAEGFHKFIPKITINIFTKSKNKDINTAKLEDCIIRAGKAFQTITGHKVSRPMSVFDLAEVVSVSKTYDELRVNLDSYTSSYHSLYLLQIAATVYFAFRSTEVIIENEKIDFSK